MCGRSVLVFVIILCVLSDTMTAQEPHVAIAGTVIDSVGMAIAGVNITVENTGMGTTTDSAGYFRLTLLAGRPYLLVFSHIGYTTRQQFVPTGNRDQQTYTLHITLRDQPQSISEVSIIANQPPQGTLQRIETKYFGQLPNPSGSFEALLKTMPGVSSHNELSTQYSVRGGSFDENLVYVNGVEVYRPLLVRSGQQEGLSFINPDMVAAVAFSAGGFDARFGDKMSSVLDVRYRTPGQFVGNASLSLLGASASVEGTDAGRRLTYLAGVRYKTSQYLLGTLDTKGEYSPDFFDTQSLLTYRLTDGLNLELLTHVAQNRYRFVSEIRNTNFGTFYNAYNLLIYYEGQEVDHYTSGTGAITLGFRPTDRLTLKLTGSVYLSHEQETFDIEGAYSLDGLDSGWDSAGDSAVNIGVGSELIHARNYLEARIRSASHTGTYRNGNGSWRWSAAWQNETTTDRMNEWAMLDSAGYSVPNTGERIELKYARCADNHLVANRLTSYLQYDHRLTGNRLVWIVTAGLRLNGNDVNREWLASPRASITIRPLSMPQFTGHIAAGLYGQPPGYRELRNTQGQMNTAVKAQRSVHYVAGAEYAFRVGQLPFSLSTELYYKRLSRLVPYKMENVRIYYAGNNMAKGYIVGWDIKLNGEFVKGAESWVSLSLMHSRVNIDGYGYGSFPLPTDQMVNFNLFFQDYIPGAPTWRAYLNLAFGTPLPYHYPVEGRYDLTFRMPPYRRADMGFSKEFFKNERPHRFVKQIWLNAEILNLFGTYNTVSYQWIQVVSNRYGLKQQYAVPNYLTARRMNVKLSVAF